jgi:uncharacterized protein
MPRPRSTSSATTVLDGPLAPTRLAADGPPVTRGDRSTVRIHPERAADDRVAEILAAGIVAHVAFADDGQPVAIPMTYHFDPAEPARLYLHGAHHSRLMHHLASGAPVCVSVTLVDGLVYSRMALYHSVNYRSAVCFGRATATPPLARQRELLEAMIGRYFPGRTAGRDYVPVPEAHMQATAFVALAIEEWSAKVRSGPPKGPTDRDESAPGTAGTIDFARPL